MADVPSPEEAVPARSPGGKNGWFGVRKELGKALPLYSYLWNDLRYKYHETEDLSQPVAQ